MTLQTFRRRRIKLRKESSALPMVLEFYSPCISIGLMKKTRKWSNVGKAMPKECLSSCVFRLLYTSAYNLEIVDWSLLCCGRCITCIISPDYSAQSTGHLIVLSRTSLSAFIYPTEWISTSHPLKLERSYRAIRSTYIRRLGQRALVLESRHQSDVWPIGDIVTTMGTALSKGRPPTLQPLQASTYSCILQAWRREAAYSLCHRTAASAVSYIPFPLLCWPICVLVQCPSYHF